MKQKTAGRDKLLGRKNKQNLASLFLQHLQSFIDAYDCFDTLLKAVFVAVERILPTRYFVQRR